jgi:hypothetical protein
VRLPGVWVFGNVGWLGVWIFGADTGEFGGVIRFIVPEPDMPEPDVPELDGVSVPDVSVPDVPVPDMPEPEVPDIPEPDIPEPDIPEPDMPEPDVPVLGIRELGRVGRVGVVEPEVVEPEVVEPETLGVVGTVVSAGLLLLDVPTCGFIWAATGRASATLVASNPSRPAVRLAKCTELSEFIDHPPTYCNVKKV